MKNFNLTTIHQHKRKTFYSLTSMTKESNLLSQSFRGFFWGGFLGLAAGGGCLVLVVCFGFFAFRDSNVFYLDGDAKLSSWI